MLCWKAFHENKVVYNLFFTGLKIKSRTFRIVLNKTLKGIRGVRLDSRKVLRAPGPWTKYF